MKSVELFAGGRGLGLSIAGFEPAVVIERDKWACDEQILRLPIGAGLGNS